MSSIYLTYFIFSYQTGRQIHFTPGVIHIPSASDSRPTHNGISVQRYSSSDDSDHRDHENANVSAGYVQGILLLDIVVLKTDSFLASTCCAKKFPYPSHRRFSFSLNPSLPWKF